ncbi:hypothetical protein VTH8203_04334 [Vibrio thalassae]|uniref:Uncharacterized protein n=1 Tax=Vibrio thalassae TaxID=1243014 RepID=A0A240EQV5_9VIBR|nr:hypothetical protein VTH8203_04334 [Vibrio thalassae]
MSTFIELLRTHKKALEHQYANSTQPRYALGYPSDVTV